MEEEIKYKLKKAITLMKMEVLKKEEELNKLKRRLENQKK